MSYHGDYSALGTVDFKFTSLSSGGSPMALANGTANVYRSNSMTESAAGVTLTPDFDGRTAVNHVHIETGADTVFYTPGNDYQVILIVGQIAGIAVGGYLLGEFSIGNRSGLRPTTVGRTLAVSPTGEAGIDWSNIGAPTTTQNLSGTTVKTATDVETDTQDIQTRLPAAIVGGRMDSIVNAWGVGTPLQPTVQGRTLDVTAAGEAGIDWANIGAPTTTQNLSGTTVKTATDVETDTQDIQTRLPAALTGGRMDSSVGAWQSGAGTPLVPTVQGRTVDITVTGEAGIDWNNIGAPTTTVNLSGTTIKTATDVEADTQDIQTRLPTALTGGRMDSQVNAWGAGTPVQPTVPGRTLDVTATGAAGIDWANIENPAATVDLINTTVAAGAGLTQAQVRDAVWNAARTNFGSASTFGEHTFAKVKGYEGIGTPLQGTVMGRTLDITLAGEAGIDWANIGAPTTIVNLSGTTIQTATDVEADTANMQTRLPAALSGGRMDSVVNAWGVGTPLQPTTQGRTLDVTGTGEAGIDWNNIGAPTTTQNLSGTTVKTATDVETDTADIQTRLPAALVSGRVDASVGAMAANVMTASAAAADLTTELQTGLATAAAVATVQADTDDIQTRLPATLSGGRMRVDIEAIGANVTAGTNLRQALIGAVTGAAVAGTLSTTQCTTDLTIDNNDMNGRLLTFLTGNNPQVQTEITASASAGGLLTFTAIPQAVLAGDTFIIT